MKNLFEQQGCEEVLDRLKKLRPDAQRQWGSMNVSQMLAHCAEAMEMSIGIKQPPRLLIGRLFGWIAKPSYTNEKPFARNLPTDKSFVIADSREFESEKERLVKLIRQFHEGGAGKCTTHPHAFFGKLTPGEWSRGMYKHLDHHLRQFGV